MKKKSKLILLIILGFILLIPIVILIFYAIGILQQTFPNQITYIGLRPDFPFDGNNIIIHLTYSSAPDNWNLGWNDFIISWADAVTTSINGRTCTELGLYRDHAGEWSGGCGLNPILNDNNVISKTATLDGQPVKEISLGRDGVTVSGFPVATQGNLVVDIKVEIKCVIGTEKCSGKNLLICESIEKTFPAWYGDTWTATVNRYTDKGEVLNKCGVIKEIEVYRFENNVCTKLTIDESKKLTNDYLTKEDCEGKIIEIPEVILTPEEKTEVISEIENSVTNNESTEKQIELIQNTNTDINTQKEIVESSNIPEPKKIEIITSLTSIEKENFWNQKTLGIKNLYLIISLISLVVIFIIVFIILIKIGRKR